MASIYRQLFFKAAPADVLAAARESVASLGWRVASDDNNKLVAAEYFVFWASQQARVTMKVYPSEGETLLILRAWSWGLRWLSAQYLEDILDQLGSRVSRRLAGDDIMVDPVAPPRRSIKTTMGGFLAFAAGAAGTAVMYFGVLSDPRYVSWYHASLTLLFFVSCVALAVVGVAILGRGRPPSILLATVGTATMVAGLVLALLPHATPIVLPAVTAALVGFFALTAGLLTLLDRDHRRDYEV